MMVITFDLILTYFQLFGENFFVANSLSPLLSNQKLKSEIK